MNLMTINNKEYQVKGLDWALVVWLIPLLLDYYIGKVIRVLIIINKRKQR